MRKLTYRTYKGKTDASEYEYYHHHKLPVEARRFFSRCHVTGGQYVVMVSCGKTVVGAFQYYIEGKELVAAGTWVRIGYRRYGLAKNMWVRAISRVRPRVIVVTTTSRGGNKLVGSLKNKFTKLDWDHSHRGK